MDYEVIINPNTISGFPVRVYRGPDKELAFRVLESYVKAREHPRLIEIKDSNEKNKKTDTEKEEKSPIADNPDVVRIEAEPRYLEDGEVNGVQEDNDHPKMPFLVKDAKAQDGWVWKLDINIKTGEVIGWPKEITADVHYKVCDCCRVKYAGKEYYEYVPDFLATNDGRYSDYIILSIEDGKIVKWNEKNCRQFLAEVFGGRREDFEKRSQYGKSSSIWHQPRPRDIARTQRTCSPASSGGDA